MKNFGKPFKYTFTILILVLAPIFLFGFLAPSSDNSKTITTPTKALPANPSQNNPYGTAQTTQSPNYAGLNNSGQQSFLPTENLDKATSVGLTQAFTLVKGQESKAWVDAGNGRTLIEINKDKNIIVSYPISFESEFVSQLLAYPVVIQPINDITPVVHTYSKSSSRGMFIFLLLLAFAGWVYTQRKRRMRTNFATAVTNSSSVIKNGEKLDVPSTKFEDIAGCEEAISELKELVEFLLAPERFERVGAKPPSGALLVGPPGTGKTMLARAVAGEAGVAFFSATGSDFAEMYVGVGARRVRDLFSQARKAGSAIVFIDEIDAVARRRAGAGSHSDPERENTLIALLNEMDGFVGSNIIVIAATNRDDVLDAAITRPGRLDRKVHVPLPDRLGRELILKVHSRNRPIAQDIDFVSIARRTPGLSGAEISRIVNEACMEAARNDLTIVDKDCFDRSIATVMMGRARTSALVTEHDREITAWHEAGHTICALLQPAADDPVSVSIIPRGAAGGITWMSGNDDSFLTREKALARMVTSLGGRAAEEILLNGEFSQGAHGDLSAATNLALAMATQYGMTRLGLMVRSDEVLGAGGMEEVNLVVEELLTDARQKALDLLNENHALLKLVALELLDKETLNYQEILDLQKLIQPSNIRKDKPLVSIKAESNLQEKTNSPSKTKPKVQVYAPKLKTSLRLFKRYFRRAK